MRLIAVTLVMLFVVLYALRDWFFSLCLLIGYSGVADYPDLPNPMGTQGMTPWVLMFLAVTAVWAFGRLNQPQPLPCSRTWLIILGCYLAAELVGVARLCLDLDTFRTKASFVNPAFQEYTVQAVIVDCVYVPGRMMLIGFMLMDGIRSRRRLLMALGAVVGMTALYALVVDKEVPLAALASEGMKFRHRIQMWTERHPNDLARDFGAAVWIGVAAWTIRLGTPWPRRLALLVAPPVLLALGHTHSRGGYVGFVAAGLALTVAARSWKTAGILATCGLAVVLFAPSITERILAGVDTTGGDNNEISEITAGRDVIWPSALAAIAESPLLGYGAYGYVRSAAFDKSSALGGSEVHPHNAYLQTMLDHGVLLGWARLLPFLYIAGLSYILVGRRQDPYIRLAGLAGLAWSTTTLAMGLTGQQYGLNENNFAFWCVAGLVTAAARLPDALGAAAPIPAARVVDPRVLRTARIGLAGSSAWSAAPSSSTTESW